MFDVLEQQNISIEIKSKLTTGICDSKMSTFKAKASLIKARLEQQIIKQNIAQPQCSHKQVQIVRQLSPHTQQSQKIMIQQPIIIQKRTMSSKVQSSTKKLSTRQLQMKQLTKKQIQPFVPIHIPTRDHKVTTSQIQQKLQSTRPKCTGGNKQIQIQIQKDDKNKQCLKKLFKKVHKLEEELKQSQAERIRLKLELENCQQNDKKAHDYERKLNALQCEKFKLEVQADMLRKLLKDRDAQIQRHKHIVPKQIIKQVIIQKPIQVLVEVPKPVPGPQRIVQKIVQIPKYVQIEKKVPFEVQKQIIKTIEVPTVTEKVVYVDKPVYIDRQVPVHIDREIPVQVPIEVPIEKPVYIDRPYVQQQLLQRLKKYQMQIQHLMRINFQLDEENRQLRLTCDKLMANLQVLSMHNQAKNIEVEQLMKSNSYDYNVHSPSQQDYSLGSVKYAISAKNHTRAI